MIERFIIHFRRYAWVLQDCFDLGSKDEAAVLMREVERLHAGTIASEHELFAICIPNRDRIITFNLVNEVGAALFVQMQDSL